MKNHPNGVTLHCVVAQLGQLWSHPLEWRTRMRVIGLVLWAAAVVVGVNYGKNEAASSPAISWDLEEDVW
jgi:hypothetical protein